MLSGYAIVATNVIAGTITSSPALRFAYLYAISKPAVALVTNVAESIPRYSLQAFSAASTLLPRESFPGGVASASSFLT